MRTVVFVDGQGISGGWQASGRRATYYVPDQRNKVSAFALNSHRIGSIRRWIELPLRGGGAQRCRGGWCVAVVVEACSSSGRGVKQ